MTFAKNRMMMPMPANKMNGSAHEIDHQRQRGDLDAFDQRAEKRQRAAGRFGRVVVALDRVGDLIDEEAADEGRDRRHQE